MTPEGGNSTSLQDQAGVESKLEARGLNETTELFFFKTQLTSLAVLSVVFFKSLLPVCDM